MAVPENMRGRVLSMVFMVSQLGFVGQLFVGMLADAVGDKMAMGIFGIIPMLILSCLLLTQYKWIKQL